MAGRFRPDERAIATARGLSNNCENYTSDSYSKIAVGLIVGFEVSTLVTWKVWKARHDATLEARRSTR
jgi:hypothetical protein